MSQRLTLELDWHELFSVICMSGLMNGVRVEVAKGMSASLPKHEEKYFCDH